MNKESYIIRDHRVEKMRNSVKTNKINKLLSVLCGYF
jgi:hypothetical protein